MPMNEERQRRRLERIEQRQAEMMKRIEDRQARLEARLAQRRERVEQLMQRELEHVNQELERAFATVGDAARMSPKQEAIVAAALEQLSAKGLSELSLREIAKTAHMQAPALYWHFKNKEVLVDYMAEAILQKEFKDLHPRADDQPWQEWLLNHMLRLRRAMLAYPDGARVVAGAHPYPAVTLGKMFETTLASLVSAGVDLEKAGGVSIAATTYTFGYVIEEQASPSPEELKNFDFSMFGDASPLVAKLMDIRINRPVDPDADYINGLRMIIRGADV